MWNPENNIQNKSMKKYVPKSNSEEWKVFFLMHISNAEATIKEKPGCVCGGGYTKKLKVCKPKTSKERGNKYSWCIKELVSRYLEYSPPPSKKTQIDKEHRDKLLIGLDWLAGSSGLRHQ